MENIRTEFLRLYDFMYDSQIAEKLGVSREYIRQIRNEFGLPKKINKSVCTIRSYKEEDFVVIFKLLKEGKPIKEIAKKLKRSVFSLRQACQNRDIKISDYNLAREYIRARDPRAKNKELKKARKLYRSGYSLYGIFKTINISRALIYRWKKLGYLDE